MLISIWYQVNAGPADTNTDIDTFNIENEHILMITKSQSFNFHDN